MPVPAAMANNPSSLPLHRIRFYDHTPSPITAISFAPLPLPPPRNPSSSKGKSKDPQPVDQREEFGVLILARENGEVEIWEYVKSDEGNNMCGNWVLEKTLPPTLTHPTISSIALVIRDPLNFHRKSYAVPKIEDLRLFTAGSDSTDLTERCLSSGKILQTYDIPSPPLWSLSVSPTHDLLCLATSSASLHFLTIPQPTIFDSSPALAPPPSHLLRCDTLPSRTRTVSIAWGIPKLERVSDAHSAQDENDDDQWEWRDNYLITGNSDSSFRRWELPPPLNPNKPGLNRVILKSRAVVEKVAKPGRGGKKISQGSSNQKGTIVWGVGVLPDHNFVTSDSLGNVTFWDGATMAQKQNFRAHKADGMCLTIGPGGRSVFTSGPDQRVCQFINVPSTSGSGSQWVLTSSKRVHSHDVRALAIFPPYIPMSSNHPLAQPTLNPSYAPVLASGGWDMSLSLTSAGTPDLLSERLKNALSKPRGAVRAIFEESFSRKMGYLSGGRMNNRISFAKSARLVLGRKDRGVGIWKILDDEEGWEKVLEMELKLRTNLISSSISSDGKWLAVSDLYETKLFHLSSQGNTIRPTRIKSFLNTLSSSPLLEHLSIGLRGSGSSSILFTPDSQRLVLGSITTGQLIVIELQEDFDEDVNVIKCFAREDKIVDGRVVKGKPNGHTNGDVNMSDESDEDDESDDEVPSNKEEKSAWVSCLAVSEDGQWLAASDLDGRTGVWNLDTLQLHATLPTLPHSPISLSFPPSSPLLLLALPSNTLQFYHLEHRRLLPPSMQLYDLQNSLASLHTPLHGISFSSSREGKTVKTIIWGMDYLVTIKLDLDSITKIKGRRTSESPSLIPSIDTSPIGLVNGNGGSLSKAMRKKRAREAKEQRDNLDSPSSDQIDNLSNHGKEEEGCKIVRDRFKNILGVGWVQEEMVIVERPLGDYAGELPGGFWTGGFGRS
ncbi:uncharacterized protein IL334_007912 [Kwoniella shivajii]|uniref:U3 small nucleolar RNA-associated protein 4 n=1 Tax=Kwoniella shivajii TaxID=564305 RepID=A0ABZ1DA01_9TREE|nr:hypothetical protein IL334_007912 [Kwoniella shivajii]